MKVNNLIHWINTLGILYRGLIKKSILSVWVSEFRHQCFTIRHWHWSVNRSHPIITHIFVPFFSVCLSADNIHPHSPPEVPEGGRSRHHEGGDPRGGADRGRWRDWPRWDGTEEGPDPLVQRSEPHPDTGTDSVPRRDMFCSDRWPVKLERDENAALVRQWLCTAGV